MKGIPNDTVVHYVVDKRRSPNIDAGVCHA